MPVKSLGTWEVTYMQVLDETGKVDKKLEPKLSSEQLLKLYRTMVLSREGDMRMLNLQRQGRIGTFGMCVGQEGITASAAMAMNDDDWFVGSYRELAGRLYRGETLMNPLRIYVGMEEGHLMPEGGMKRTLPINIIIASQCLHAAGIGYAMKYKGEKSAAVAFFGDGATSQGDFHEGLNFAATWQAPVVFICQNNQWAISTPRSKQTHARTIAQKAIAYDMPTIQVDGNDPLAVYKATKEALERAHSGGGPTFIEAVTYRLMMHTTADDPKKYRDEAEAEKMWKFEPLTRFKMYLEAKGIWNDKKEKALRDEIKAEIDAAIAEFEATLDKFAVDAPFDYLFGTKHPYYESQREQLLADLAWEKSHGKA